MSVPSLDFTPIVLVSVVIIFENLLSLRSQILTTPPLLTKILLGLISR